LNAIVLPFVTPEEEGLEATGRSGFIVTDRSRFADAEREEALQQQLEEAPTPDEQERILAALDAHHAEKEADEKRAQEEADAKYDEENSRW
jgi:predicted RNA-binding protein YlxR (DUF448 family)